MLHYNLFILNNSENASHNSSSKTALISYFRNEIKSHMKLSFFWLSLARNTCKAQVVTRR